MVRGSDGYDYEDLAALLLRERAQTRHNYQKAYQEAHDETYRELVESSYSFPSTRTLPAPGSRPQGPG